MSLVTVESKGGAVVITYANPPLGTMTYQGSMEMAEAVRAASEDPTVRCIILTGGLPGVFVRHYDIAELVGLGWALSEPAGPGSRPPAPSRPGGAFGQLVDLIAEAPKPVIAAINGLCMGGGFEIALTCDLRIAGQDVEAIGLPETRIGIFPGGGGTQRLPRVVGEAKALQMILMGTVVTGPEAAAMGLVDESVADPLARALELAAMFGSRGAEGLAQAKRLTRAALGRSLVEGLADERRTFVEVMKTASARAGLKMALPPAEIQQS